MAIGTAEAGERCGDDRTARSRRRLSGTATRLVALAAIAVGGLLFAGTAEASPLAGGRTAAPDGGGALERVEYRPAVRYRGPYWHAPVPRVVVRPRVRWHGYYRGEGFGPLYAGPGVVATERPFYGAAPYGGYAADGYATGGYPPAGVPLAADPRAAVLLPPGRLPRTIVDVYHRPVPWTEAWYAWCFDRYRSFDPRSGTFLGYDGRRHFCR